MYYRIISKGGDIMLKKVLIAFVISIIVPIIIPGIYGLFLQQMFGYESLTHMTTHSLLLALIFTVIICTMLILDKLEKKAEIVEKEQETKHVV